MPKHTTIKIQDDLLKIGKKLGFDAKKEEVLPSIKGGYSPRYDVVWYLDLEAHIDAVSVVKKLGVPKEWAGYLKKLPLAVFEVEGSTTTSKNQVGNFANLCMAPALFKFAIVNNSEASNEVDTYRRGVRIYRTYRYLLGDRNIIFLNWTHFPENLVSGDNTLAFNIEKAIPGERRGSGGESVSRIPAKRVVEILSRAGLFVQRDVPTAALEWAYEVTKRLQALPSADDDSFLCAKEVTWNPETGEVRKVRDVNDWFYVPKIDVLSGFYLPQSFSEFLVSLAHSCGKDACHYPLLSYIASNSKKRIFFPLITAEIESGKAKHLNGGIMNMSSYSFIGTLVSEKEGKHHLDTFTRNLGVQNVFFRDIAEFKD